MNIYTTKALSTLLPLFLCGLMQPCALSAQQTGSQPPPVSASTSNAGVAQQQQSSPDQSNDQGQQLQQQEDKASQDMINGTPASSKELPDSPDMVRSSQTAPPQTQSTPLPAHMGTAAAEQLRPSGSMAARPAGAAIAPARQHQVRSLLIKLGAIAGAGVALGTVFALTRAGGSVPPGAK